MMNKARIQQLSAAVEKHSERALAAERHIWKNPETGYREWKTTEFLASQFRELGYEPVMAGNIPGFYCDLDTGRPGPKLLIMGELDSLIVATHSECDPATGYVHACGHHAQCAALLGVAAALREPGVLSGMSGSIRLMAVPAEELIEIGYREELRKQGVIKYYGGKVEFLYRGYMDGCDLAFMVHTANLDRPGIGYEAGCNGCVAKNIDYVGVSAHAGGSPDQGVNALYAATMGMQAVNSLRETFRDDDHVRFHPIVTRGGGAVNAIPNDVRLESYVRAASLEAIAMNNKKVNRALAGSAAALGANVVLHDRAGYMPLHNNKLLLEVVDTVVTESFGAEALEASDDWGTGCTDMGDVAAVMPAVHPYASGAAGTGHGSDYHIEDPVAAVVTCAKFQVLMADALLQDGAALAKKVIAESKPQFASKEDYFKALDSLFFDSEAVQYNEDGTLTIRYCSK